MRNGSRVTFVYLLMSILLAVSAYIAVSFLWSYSGDSMSFAVRAFFYVLNMMTVCLLYNHLWQNGENW